MNAVNCALARALALSHHCVQPLWAIIMRARTRVFGGKAAAAVKPIVKHVIRFRVCACDGDGGGVGGSWRWYVCACVAKGHEMNLLMLMLTFWFC